MEKVLRKVLHGGVWLVVSLRVSLERSLKVWAEVWLGAFDRGCRWKVSQEVSPVVSPAYRARVSWGVAGGA